MSLAAWMRQALDDAPVYRTNVTVTPVAQGPLVEVVDPTTREPLEAGPPRDYNFDDERG